MLFLFLGASTFLFSVATVAQQRAGGNLSVPPSDLASDNQQRVAASEAQIVACHVLPQMRSMRSSQVQGRALFVRVFRGWDRCDSDGKLRFGNEDGTNKLRIAQVAPLYESVPPELYGGTERVVHYLTEGLVAQGHDVTLFASGDSKTTAELVAAVCPKALRRDERCVDKLVHHVILLDRVLERASEFDVIHFHIDYLHFPISRYCDLPSVTTLHGRLDLPELGPLYRRFRGVPLVSISYAQRKPLPHANWIGNVYHGVPSATRNRKGGQGGYLAFLGRISPEKRPDRAIQIALATRMHLKIAAKVDPADQVYFETTIKPLLKHPNVEYIGEIGQKEKADFLGDAYACFNRLARTV